MLLYCIERMRVVTPEMSRNAAVASSAACKSASTGVRSTTPTSFDIETRAIKSVSNARKSKKSSSMKRGATNKRSSNSKRSKTASKRPKTETAWELTASSAMLRPGTVERMKRYEIRKLHEPVRMRLFCCGSYGIDWSDQLYRDLVAMKVEDEKRKEELKDYWAEVNKLVDELLNDDE